MEIDADLIVLGVLITSVIVNSRRLGRLEGKVDKINGNLPKRRKPKEEAKT